MNSTTERRQATRFGRLWLVVCVSLIWLSFVSVADEVSELVQPVRAPPVTEVEPEAEDPFLMEGAGLGQAKPKRRLCQISLAHLLITTGVVGGATAWATAEYIKQARERLRGRLLLAVEKGDLGSLQFQWPSLIATDRNLAFELVAFAILEGNFSMALDLLNQTDPSAFYQSSWDRFGSEFLYFRDYSLQRDWTLGKKIFENASSDFGPAILRRALLDDGPATADVFFEPGRDYSDNPLLRETARILIDRQEINRLDYLKKIGGLKLNLNDLTLFAVRQNRPEALAFLMENGGELPKYDLAGTADLLRKSKALFTTFSDHAGKPEASVPGLRSLAGAVARAGDLEQMAILLDPKHGRKDLANEFFALAMTHKGVPQMVKIFLDSGADIHFDREAALRSAVAANSFSAFAPLIRAGADIHVNNEEPLRIAIKVGDSSTARFLIRRGADPKVAAENE